MKYSGTYIRVSDFDKSVKFFEEVLQAKASIYSPGRWADMGGFGIYCPEYDKSNNVPSSTLDSGMKTGINTVIELSCEDIELEYKRLKSFVPEISDLCHLNIQASCHFFHFKDYDGNMFEVSYYPDGV